MSVFPRCLVPQPPSLCSLRTLPHPASLRGLLRQGRSHLRLHFHLGTHPFRQDPAQGSWPLTRNIAELPPHGLPVASCFRFSSTFLPGVCSCPLASWPDLLSSLRLCRLRLGHKTQTEPNDHHMLALDLSAILKTRKHRKRSLIKFVYRFSLNQPGAI